MNIYDTEGYFIEVNDAFCEMMGYTRNELVRMHFKEIIHPDNLKESDEKFDDIIKGESNVANSIRKCVSKEGEIV